MLHASAVEAKLPHLALLALAAARGFNMCCAEKEKRRKEKRREVKRREEKRREEKRREEKRREEKRRVCSFHVLPLLGEFR